MNLHPLPITEVSCPLCGAPPHEVCIRRPNEPKDRVPHNERRIAALDKLPEDVQKSVLGCMCPVCRARPGEPCEFKDNDKYPNAPFHPSRAYWDVERPPWPAANNTRILDTECPKCGAGASECCTYGGKELRIFHKERKEAANVYFTVENIRTVPCNTCGSAVGEPCRRMTVKDKSEPRGYRYIAKGEGPYKESCCRGRMTAFLKEIKKNGFDRDKLDARKSTRDNLDKLRRAKTERDGIMAGLGRFYPHQYEESAADTGTHAEVEG